MASVELDAMMREFVPRRRLETDAQDVRGLLDELERRYPRLRFRLRDELGAVRKFVRVFVNGEEISALRGLDTPIAPSDRVDVLHSIQGG
jgi:molybdopterin synthase sulfur carrier subunit